MAAEIDAIVTMGPYAPFLEDVASHPVVSGLRLNTVMPIRGDPEAVLKRLASTGKSLFIDLKGRQLRVVGAAVPPFTEVKISHRIEVQTPVIAYFSGGRERATVAEVDGDRLILEDGPRRMIGPGESVNIVSPSLRIEGTLTDSDRNYIAAARRMNLHQYMLSYVENKSDAEEILELDPDAEIVLKIESAGGIDFARRYGNSVGRLMVARGDLHVELLRPHFMISVLREMIRLDSNAIVASRLFDSLAFQDVPSGPDITDVAFLLEIGYRTFLLGDEVCLNRDSVLDALNLLEAIAGTTRSQPPS